MNINQANTIANTLNSRGWTASAGADSNGTFINAETEDTTVQAYEFDDAIEVQCITGGIVFDFRFQDADDLAAALPGIVSRCH
ncbi:hypothetical protein [Rhizobacter sp. Root404]|uniref:hypothetical protein n=1 Tax=Rhizobacter sp. Root404 TaxID=1736528 RepID=UPI0006FF3809|nr:hypothetical protein [Rhizobacter sp. Root404]KQW36766.1 hypothetical protein ASC76_19205 [Rhizobacter sp. Root404]